MILIEISTRNRDSVLGRCLAGLINQSYQVFDVLIINDGDKEVGHTPSTAYLLEELRRCHEVTILPGSRISQAHNHNFPLYMEEFLDYRRILRLDDDIVLNYHNTQHLIDVMDITDAPAVAGLWFEMEWKDEFWHDRGRIKEFSAELNLQGKVGLLNSNWQQRMYHPDDYFMENVEHLYGACLYDAEAMRRAGGWPEVYSKGVAHGEETDGTYRLFRACGGLVVEPTVTAQHLKSPGGIRVVRDYGTAQTEDRIKWQNRLPKLNDINFEPTVAIWCQHSFGLGGAQRQFYQTVSLLQESNSGLTIHPVFTGEYLSPEECQEAFGFTYEEAEELEEYDVCIVMGHEPFYPVKAKHYILYCFFPEKKCQHPFLDYRLILGNSRFTADNVEDRWHLESGHLYPCVTPIPVLEKENIILCVSRGDPNKAPLWLMERFVEFDIEGWDFHLVMATTGGVFVEYEQQLRNFAAQHDSIFLHEDVSAEELHEWYGKARILWTANGIYGEQNPQYSEHFGLTPIEAFSAGCVPVVFDFGGHRETVTEEFRWKTEDDLKRITQSISIVFYLTDEPVAVSLKEPLVIHVPDDVEWGVSEPIPVVDVNKFNEDDYVWHWEQWIRRVNACAIELQPIERMEVEEKKIRVACWSDSPSLTTGFAQVARMAYNHFLTQEDLQIYVLGLMDTVQSWPDRFPFPFYSVPEGDLQAKKTFLGFINWVEAQGGVPDVLFGIYEPGGLAATMTNLKNAGLNAPTVVYFPIEAGYMPDHPKVINKAAFGLCNLTPYTITYCKSGVEAIRNAIPDATTQYAYHGLDHAPFKPLEPEYRSQLRKLVGWEGKFIICNVGANKRVKQQPILIDTLRILLELGYDDTYLYLHTQPFDNHTMNGWELNWIGDITSAVSGVHHLREHILYPLSKKWHGPAYQYDHQIEAHKLTVAPAPEMRAQIFHSLDFITILGMCDLYVDVSSAEGWNLPPLESIACGTPAISVNDNHVRSEIHSKYCSMINPVAQDTWHTGAPLCIVDPRDVADRIVELRADWDLAETGRAIDAVAVVDDLKWQPACELFADTIRKAYAEAQ